MDQETPINQLGNVSVPEASMITIQVWDAKSYQIGFQMQLLNLVLE